MLSFSVYSCPELSKGWLSSGGLNRVSGHSWLLFQPGSRGQRAGCHQREVLTGAVTEKIHLIIKKMIYSGDCNKENIH